MTIKYAIDYVENFEEINGCYLFKVSEEKFDTLTEAKHFLAENFKNYDQWFIGANLSIIKECMDEATFTFTKEKIMTVTNPIRIEKAIDKNNKDIAFYEEKYTRVRKADSKETIVNTIKKIKEANVECENEIKEIYELLK